MKKFVTRIFKFSIIFLVILIIIISGTICLLSQISCKIPLHKNVLVVGDSHTECAINDKIYANAINLSQSAAAYLYTYYKIEKILNQNPRIDTVLLSFHYEALIGHYVLNKDWQLNMAPHYILSFGIKELLIQDKSVLLRSILKLPELNKNLILKFLKNQDILYSDFGLGGYKYLERDKLKEDIIIQDNKKNDNYFISEYQKEYLLKIIDFCKSKGIELILINTPIFQAEQYGYPNELSGFYYQYLQGTTYFNYSSFHLPDSCYGDINHLNYKGAEFFSHYLYKNLSKDKQRASTF